MASTPIENEDARNIAVDPSIPWASLDGSTVAVTGATGLIGRNLVRALLARGGISVIALVRSPEKLWTQFEADNNLSAVRWDLCDDFDGMALAGEINYVFHCANMTDSASFVSRPVETVESTIRGARTALEIARASQGRLCMLSTMEVYGEVSGSQLLREDQGGFLDSMVIRNSYPEAKRLCEMLCASYCAEFGTDTTVVRLAQTFGPGVDREDRRVFAEFARCALEGRDITLLTTGEKRNSYLYTADATRAILTVAACGEAGAVYNAANDDTYCSVREMAEMVSRVLGDGKMDVVLRVDPDAARRFRNGGTLRLDASRLEGLGWSPEVDLPHMYERMAAFWAQQTNEDEGLAK